MATRKTKKTRIIELIEQGIDNLEIVRIADASKAYVMKTRVDYNKISPVYRASRAKKPRRGTRARQAYDMLMALDNPMSFVEAVNATGLTRWCVGKLEKKYGVEFRHDRKRPIQN